MAYPDKHEKYGGNRIRCIRYFKNVIADECFVKELSRIIMEKNIDINDLLPVKTATETAKNLMETSEDDRVRAQVSLAVLGMAIELNKVIKPVESGHSKVNPDNPFLNTQDAKFIDVQSK